MNHPIRRAVLVALVVAFAFASHASAVILYKSATRNTSAPSGTFANSGWQYEGNWGAFLGTPIAPHYFITAAHVGGGVGQNLTYGGKTYTATAMYDDPATDLRIYKTSGTFSTYAPIYTGTGETGKDAVVVGRGTQRGSTVSKNGQNKGWKWGTQDGVKSWGDNRVHGFYNGGTGIGSMLDFTFNKNGMTNEAALSSGDSGGGVFVNDNGKWKLAGINYLVDGPFSLTGTNGTGFMASLYDKGGLYQGGDNAWKYYADTTADVNGNWYATRISSRSSWIKSIIGTTTTSSTSAIATASAVAVPEPASVGLLAAGATMFLRRRRSVERPV